MVRSAPSFSSGTIAAQASAEAMLDLFLPQIESALAAFQSSGTTAWEIYDTLDATLASRNRIYRSLGDRSLVSGAGDAWLLAQINRTATNTLTLNAYQDWSTSTSTGNRAANDALFFTVTADELNFFFSLHEYEFHCVWNQATAWNWFGWGNLVRTHVVPSHRGIALSTAAITAGTSVVIGLDRDISNTIEVGAPVWVMNRTATGNALESATIEIATVEAVTSTPNITLTLANSFASGAMIGADPTAMAVWRGTNGIPVLFWTNDGSGQYSTQGSTFGSWDPGIVNTQEAGADPAATGYYLGSRPTGDITSVGAGGVIGARGTSDVAAFWGDGAQNDPQTDLMIDANTGQSHKVFDTLINSAWILSIQADPSNVIDRYVWDTSYECQDVSGTNWPATPAGVTLTTGNAPTTGQSTSAWTNLPSRMVDQAIRPNAVESMGNALFDWQNNNFHFRGIFDLDATVTTNARLFRYIVGGVRFAQIFANSATLWTFNVRNDASGGNYSRSVSALPTSAVLLDWVVDGAQMNIYVNGVDRSPTAHTGAVDFQNGPDQMDVMGLGATFILQGVYVFFGWRWGHVISLSQHQEDATELGLF